MRQPLSRQQHGFTDWSYIPTVAAAPALAGFSDDDTPARLARVLSGAILSSTIFTRAEWGAIKVLPYKAHLAMDVAVGVFALASPWLFGFAGNARARNTFIAMGITGILAGTLSRPVEMGESDAQDPHGVH